MRVEWIQYIQSKKKHNKIKLKRTQATQQERSVEQSDKSWSGKNDTPPSKHK